MTREKKARLCETLYRLAKKKGKRSTDFKEDSSRDGSYVSGFKKETKQYDLKLRGFLVRAELKEWLTMNLSADTKGTTRSLEILKGKKSVFFAVSHGATNSKLFSGPDERYQGEDYTEARPWEKFRGVIPNKFAKLLPKKVKSK